MPLTIDSQQEAARITEFITSTFEAQDFTRAIIAVSGGIDSATTLTLTAQALGPSNIITLHLPTRLTHPQHTIDAQVAIQHADIPLENQHIINLSGMIQKTWRSINRKTNKQIAPTPSPLAKGGPGKIRVEDAIFPSLVNPVLSAAEGRVRLSEAEAGGVRSAQASHKLRLANITARLRMITLYDQAKLHNALVVGTENFSEHLLGYYTRFGDEASDIEPIKHLFKTQIYQLAHFLQIPQAIIQKPPSADLWPNQSDESEMGFSYAMADPILHDFSLGTTTQEMLATAGHDPKLVESIFSQINKNSFKHYVPYSLLTTQN